MDLRLEDHQQMLQQVARDFVEREASDTDVPRWFQDGSTFQPGLFRQAAEAGWLGMLAPEELGGGGSSVMDCAVVFEQLGRAPVPGPLFASGVAAPLIVAEAGSPEQRRRWVPPMCQGSAVFTLALSDRGAGWGPETVDAVARRDGGSLVLDGVKRYVHDAADATALLCAARLDGEVVLTVVDLPRDGVTLRRHQGFVASLFDVELNGVRVDGDCVLVAGPRAWEAVDRALDRALPVLAAYQVGGCQKIFDLTVAYSSERVVFGQPIGRFQRVQDHVVDLADHLDSARWITYETLWKIDSGLPAKAAIHETKAVASESYYQGCNYAHMVFAGPGTALEHPLVAHTITSRMLYQYLGDPLYHKRRMMDELFPRR
jgi:alkylation response protein AidB-like acyl-CoA dehydrogenase